MKYKCQFHVRQRLPMGFCLEFFKERVDILESGL